jgi:hypothetical protein
MARGCYGRLKKAESKRLEGISSEKKNLERLGRGGENLQSVVVPNDDNDDYEVPP